MFLKVMQCFVRIACQITCGLKGAIELYLKPFSLSALANHFFVCVVSQLCFVSFPCFTKGGCVMTKLEAYQVIYHLRLNKYIITIYLAVNDPRVMLERVSLDDHVFSQSRSVFKTKFPLIQLQQSCANQKQSYRQGNF